MSVRNRTKSHVECTDCIEGMKRMRSNSVDVVVTSPPYNLGKDYSSYLDVLEQGAYLAWCESWVNEVARVIKPKGSFFLNLGASPRNPTVPHQLLFRILKSGAGGEGGSFVLQNTIHWIKSISITEKDGTTTSRGHFKPINSQRYLTDCHEYIFHLTLDGAVPVDRLAIGVEYQDKSNIQRWHHTAGRDRRCRGNTWFIPYETIRSRKSDRPHPATFPTQLPEWCIRLHGTSSKLVVLDPFLGLGSSWVASVRCGVGEFWGFDVDSAYVEQATQAAQNARAA